jgi:hypothetical protein
MDDSSQSLVVGAGTSFTTVVNGQVSIENKSEKEAILIQVALARG